MTQRNVLPCGSSVTDYYNIYTNGVCQIGDNNTNILTNFTPNTDSASLGVKGNINCVGISTDVSGSSTGTYYSNSCTALRIPADTSFNRPPTGLPGYIRYNTDTNEVEYYNGGNSSWENIASATPTLQQVLDTNNTANLQTITLNNTPNQSSTTISGVTSYLQSFTNFIPSVSPFTSASSTTSVEKQALREQLFIANGALNIYNDARLEVDGDPSVDATTLKSQMLLRDDNTISSNKSVTTTHRTDGITQVNTGVTKSNYSISTDENLILTADNIGLSSTGRLIIPSLASADYLDYNAGTLTLKADNVGYLTDELLLLENTNATAGNTIGVPSLEMFKSGRNGAVGDIVSTIQFNAKDSAGIKRSFGRIESTITTTTAPLNHDGALDFYSLINSVNQIVFRMNGADNENNSFRPLDLNGNALKTSTGDLSIQAFASTGNGDIFLQPKTTASVSVAGNMTIPFTSYNYKVGDISTQQGTLGATFVGFNDSVNLYASSLSNTTMTITNGTTNQQTQVTTNQVYINDTTNVKSIQINNDANVNQNRIDLYKSIGGGIYNQSGIVNDNSVQQLFLLYQDNANGRSLNIANDSASGGVIDYTDQIGGGQPFTIKSQLTDFNIQSNTTKLTLSVPTATQPLQFDSDVINLQNTNTTTSTSNHNADIRATSIGLESTTFLKLQLNGTDIWIPYFTSDPSL